ncbi:MAG: alanine racemase [Gammaproteobacteria bacterium]|nr:alanine racemase [Gammaproteobacteria bacterium]
MKINTEPHSIRPVKATINLQALKYNLARVKQLAPCSRVISVIKANAYGHGVLPVAKALNDSDCFAVARLDEALYLRNNGIDKSIMLLEGVFSVDDYFTCSEQGFIPSIHCLEQFQWLQEFAQQNFSRYGQLSGERNSSKPLDYWLKVDTGMHRLGLSEADFMLMLEKISQLKPELMPTGIMSHFSCADESEHSSNVIQLTQFNNLCSKPAMAERLADIDKSMANSAAILSLPEAHFDWVRPGIMLYGVSPFETSATPDNDSPRTVLSEQLKPVMTLSSELIAIKKLKQGDCIGYGASWCCPEDMSIGVVAIGYGDGYPRHAPCGTPVLIHGIEAPLVGRVSMDMITVDLRVFEQQSVTVRIGDRVILWGDGLPVERVSRKAGTIAYELLCQITQRVYLNYEQ